MTIHELRRLAQNIVRSCGHVDMYPQDVVVTQSLYETGIVTTISMDLFGRYRIKATGDTADEAMRKFRLQVISASARESAQHCDPIHLGM